MDIKALFDDMPYTLHTDVAWSLCEEMIRTVPLFQNCEQGFIALTALAMRPQLYLMGDVVAHEGALATEIFFVLKGYVNVVANGKVCVCVCLSVCVCVCGCV